MMELVQLRAKFCSLKEFLCGCCGIVLRLGLDKEYRFTYDKDHVALRDVLPLPPGAILWTGDELPVFVVAEALFDGNKGALIYA
jgi:hypothetical protein